MITLLTLLPLLLFSTHSNAAGGNGSGGVGNKFDLDERISVYSPKDGYYKLGQGKILDGTTQEELLSFEWIDKSKVKKDKSLFNAKMGELSGFEYVQDRNQPTQQKYWIACVSDSKCMKLKQTSKTNKKVLDVIGALTTTQNK